MCLDSSVIDLATLPILFLSSPHYSPYIRIYTRPTISASPRRFRTRRFSTRRRCVALVIRGGESLAASFELQCFLMVWIFNPHVGRQVGRQAGRRLPVYMSIYLIDSVILCLLPLSLFFLFSFCGGKSGRDIAPDSILPVLLPGFCKGGGYDEREDDCGFGVYLWRCPSWVVC